MHHSKTRLLICDDDSLVHFSLKTLFEQEYALTFAHSFQKAREAIRNQWFPVALVDMSIEQKHDGVALIEELKRLSPDTLFVAFSGSDEYQLVRGALKGGAVDYLLKDANPEILSLLLRQLSDKAKLHLLNQTKDSEIQKHHRKHQMLGSSASIEALRIQLERVRDIDANVVITGETGTGKEVVARQLRRWTKSGQSLPFVAVDSSTIQSSMAEGLLFGYEKGAFTGADRLTKGLFEEANGGVIYFDEISNMPLEIQAKLLRVIQEKEIVRLGSSRVLPLEFRVVCATNQPLERLVAEGKFKPDLYQRLCVIPIEIPPLRERLQDLPELAKHFLGVHGHAGIPREFTEEAIETLQRYPWPGNIRELSNVIAYVLATSSESKLDVADLPARLRNSILPPDKSFLIANQPVQSENFGNFYAAVEEYEKSFLRDAFKESSGNISRLAQKIEMDRSHLYTKLKYYGIYERSSGKLGSVGAT